MSFFSKRKIKHILTIFGTTFGIYFSCLMFGAFGASSNIEAITYAAHNERNKDGTNFNYVEATPLKPTTLFNDDVSSASLAFDNYWHFDGRPNIYAFKKWDVSFNEAKEENVYPLSFDYVINQQKETISTPIISTIANRWEGDPSHLELKTINEIKPDYIEKLLKDEVAVQNSVILSHPLAYKMAGTNIESLIGLKINDGVVFTNPRYNPAHYNNNIDKPIIDEINIIGVFDEKSSNRVSKYFGDNFVFMFGGTFGTYNHSGLKIGCHLSSDDYANAIAINQFIGLDNDNSTITFYNYKNNEFVNGNLQKTYLNIMKINDSGAPTISFCCSIVIFSILIIVFIKKIVKSRSKKSLLCFIITSLLFGLFFIKFKYLSFGSYCVPLLNSLGVGLLFVVSFVMFFMLLGVKRKRKIKSPKLDTQPTNKFVRNILPYIVLSSLIISIYALLNFVIAKEKSLIVPAGISFVGMTLSLFYQQPSFTLLENRIKQPVVRLGVSKLMPFIICAVFSSTIIFFFSKMISVISFKAITMMLTIFGSFFVCICLEIVSKKKNSSKPDELPTDYQEYEL